MLLLAASTVQLWAAHDDEGLATQNVNIKEVGQKLVASFDLVLDKVNLGSNHQLFVTPFVEGAGQRTYFPSVLVNGRNMQYVYERSGLGKDISSQYNNINKVVRRQNGKAQRMAYTETVAIEPWMRQGKLNFRLAVDTCGCGNVDGMGMTPAIPFNITPDMPKPEMHFYAAYIVPPVKEAPVVNHEGRARVQFEVNRIELHTEPYVCKSGQKIDNREQLKVIIDSIDYAMSDPNVEIANINICGYASPESPYVHNEYLSTNRSRVLVEYIAARYNLPQEKCSYSAVTENWGEFREQVVAATDITEKQRKDLLELIDKPTYGAADFDEKERLLKNDARFAKLYKEKILPDWFPLLRCTQFTISTRLKPTSDERLAEIIKKTPELLSLNQMFRVANLYEEGSPEFIETFNIALRFYSDDPIANLNAAVAAIKAGKYDRAAELLKSAGNSPEAENARGIIAAHKKDMQTALRHFEAAGRLHEAQLNKEQIKNNEK